MSLLAPDPRRYGTPGEVLIYRSQSVTLKNEGNFSSCPEFTITGPVTAPFYVRDNRGRQLIVKQSLLSGEVLTVDTNARIALLDGAIASVGGRWPTFEPGDNTYTFEAPDNGDVSTLTISYCSAWK